MISRISQMFFKQKPDILDETRQFIVDLVASDIWVLAIGIHGTPTVSDDDSFSAAIQVLVPLRKPLSELSDDDSIFPFNFRRDGRRIMPFFSSEERARDFLADSGFSSSISLFQPFSLIAGFVAAPQNDKFDLILDMRSPEERGIEDNERLLLRSLSTNM